MILALSHISALEYWRNLSLTAANDPSVPWPSERAVSTEEVRRRFHSDDPPLLPPNFALPSECTLPLHMLSPNRKSKAQVDGIVRHAWTHDLPGNSLAYAGNGMYISTPDFVFLQMARTMSLPALIYLADELCGTYALQIGARMRQTREPLTTTSTLATFLQDAPNSAGSKKALRAAKLAIDGSASPMETILQMLLCLPYRYGGYGLPRPVMNHQIEIPENLRAKFNKRYYKCDLFWPDINLAIEYDSRDFHAIEDKMTQDALRRNDLLELGISVITVTPRQVFDGFQLNKLAHHLAKKLKHRLVYVDPEFTRNHIALREELKSILRRNLAVSAKPSLQAPTQTHGHHLHE